MNATKAQAFHNVKKLNVEPSTYGHWYISCVHYGKEIHTVTTNSKAVDNWHSLPDETDHNGKNRVHQGYLALCNEIIKDNKEF
jgi:hypothetical protein